CIAIGALSAGALLAYIFKTMEVKKAFKIFGVFYLGAVFIMTAIAIGIAIFTPSGRAVVYAIGALLFTASDIVLIFNTFSGVTKFSMRICNLSLYYLGQILIAFSMFL
nr:lysoplasmalogenase [Erysipelotrichaceae bacterium]